MPNSVIMRRSVTAPFGKFEEGAVVTGYSTSQLNLLIESGAALPIEAAEGGELVRATRGPGGGNRILHNLVSDVLPRPSGFDWTPPISVYLVGADVHTDYEWDNWRNPVLTHLWCSITRGNDTTGDGSIGNPYKSLKKALQSVTADYTQINVEAGEYDYLNGWISSATPAYHINVVAVGGPVVSSTRWTGTWAETGSGTQTYTASRSNFARALDWTYLDEDGTPARFTVVASQEACEAIPHSVYVSGSTVYLHLHDGRAIDSNVHVLINQNAGYWSSAKRCAVRGVEFRGGTDGAFLTLSTGVTTDTVLVFDGCKFNFSSTNGLSARGVGLSVLAGCRAYGNMADGFNYQASAGVTSPKMVEIACAAWGNGDPSDGVDNDNLSTLHGNARGLRVRTTGRGGHGPSFADIGSSKSWNIGCGALGSRAVGLSAATQRTTFLASDTAVMWLDMCYSAGDVQSAYVSNGGAIYTRNCSLPGVTLPEF